MLQSERVIATADGTISNVALSLIDFGFTQAEVEAADYLEVTVDNDVRYRVDGVAPDASTGFLVVADTAPRIPSSLGGKAWLLDFQIIRATGSDAAALITLFAV